MESLDFKERIRLEVLDKSKTYREYLVDKEYLIFSSSFKENKYYLLKGYEGNYLHLTGVHTSLNPKEFYYKCLDESLNENEFEIYNQNEDKKLRKFYIKSKMQALKYLSNFYSNIIGVEEKYSKGKLSCELAVASENITIGYAKYNYCTPKTLLKGNKLLNSETLKCDLLISKNRDSMNYDNIVIGDEEILNIFLKEHLEIAFDKTQK